MTRSSAPGMLIALAVLLAALLLAFTVGRYPAGLGDLFHVIAAKLDRPAVRRAGGGDRRDAADPRAARACRGSGRRGARHCRRGVPGLVSQSAGVARFARRLVGRGAWRGARHLFLARRIRHRGVRVRRRPGGGQRRLSDRLGDARARSDSAAGADRRCHRLAARRRRRPRQVCRRSVQPAPGHDVLAPGKPRGHDCIRSRAAARAGRVRHAGSRRAALAHERHVAARTKRRARSACRPGRCASPLLRPQRW